MKAPSDYSDIQNLCPCGFFPSKHNLGDTELKFCIFFITFITLISHKDWKLWLEKETKIQNWEEKSNRLVSWLKSILVAINFRLPLQKKLKQVV